MNASPAAETTHLVVARELDTPDLPLLEGAILQTLNSHRDLPGHELLTELGVRPVRDPQSVGAQTITALRAKAHLFFVEGTTCLYSAASASDTDSTDDDGFVIILTDVIRTHHPHSIYIASLQRLLKSPARQHALRQVFADAGCAVHCGDGPPIDFAEPDALLRWDLLTSFSGAERTAALTRLMLGLVGRHRQGKWVLSPDRLPIGCRLGEGNQVLIDDHPATRHAISKIIQLMGDPTVTTAEVGQMLHAIGPNFIRPADDRQPDIEHDSNDPARRYDAEAIDPASLDAECRRLLDLWEHGTLEVKILNQLPDVRAYLEHPVESTADGQSVVSFAYHPGIPDGGWATPKDFASARAVRDLVRQEAAQDPAAPRV